MPDLLYISEVGNYRLLYASFRIKWHVPDLKFVFFFLDFSSYGPIFFRIS